MQPCGKCGDYNSDGSIFCGHCANRLNNNCPACGFKNLMQQKFCGSCGKQLLSDGTLSPLPKPPLPPKSSSGIGQLPVAALETLADQRPVFASAASATAPAQVIPGSSVSTSKLSSYALASIEFANWKQLLAQSEDPQRLEAYQAEVLADIAQKITKAGGQINASKNKILFVSFRQEATPEESLNKAIETSLQLLGTLYQLEKTILPLRIGLDVEFSNSRNPLTSTLERSVGQPNTLMVSERVYQALHGRYPMEAVGPISIGNQNLTFYRLSVQAPSVSKPKPSVSSVSSIPLPRQKPREPESNRGFEPPAQSVEPASHERSFPAADSMSPPVTPDLPHYSPPPLGLVKAPRPQNTTYDQAVAALTNDFSAFLSQGVAGAKGQILSLSADDGLGKSSIIHTARAQSDPENQLGIWMGGNNYRCFQREGLPLLFWLELVQNLLSLVFEGQPKGDVQEALDRFLNYIYADHPPEDVTSFLADFLLIQHPQPLGVDTGEALGRIELFFLAFIRKLTTNRPLILVFEDLMYADLPSLDLLSRLLERGLMQSPVYLVLTYNRDFYAAGRLAEELKKWPCKELVIGNLDEAAREKFLDEGPLGGQLKQFPSSLIQPLVRQSKGLPLYLEEALRLMHLREVLTVDSNTGKFLPNTDFNLADWHLSPQLAEVIFARFEFLDEQSLYLLQLASVLGEKFAVNMLFSLAQMDEEAFNQALTLLFNHGYLTPDAANSGRFRHGLIWETVYETIEDELRLQMHQLISEALENDFNNEITVNPALIAYHAQQGALPNRAVNYWNLAAIYCGQIGSLAGLNRSMFLALDLMRKTQSAPLHTQELALRMMESAGAFNLDAEPLLAASMLEWVFHYRKDEGEPLKLIEPLGLLASAYENGGDYPKALATLEKSLELIDPTVYPLESASLLINKMEYLHTLGRFQQARDLMETVLEPMVRLYSATNPELMEGFIQARLLKAQILLAQCDSEAMTEAESALQLATERGLEGLQIALRLLISHIHLRNGAYETCNLEADSLLNAIERLEDPNWFLAQWGLLAMMYHCELEDWNSASQLVLTVISKAEVSRDYHSWVVAQVYAGYISARLGQSKEAQQLLEQAIDLSSEYRFASAALTGWRFLADFELTLNNIDIAHEIACKALDIASKPDIQNKFEWVQLTLLCARAFLAKDQPKEAGKLLEPLWPLVVKTRFQPLMAACAFEIGQLYKALAQNVPADLSRKYLTRSVEFFMKAKMVWLELRNTSQVKKVELAVPRL
jgi:tetratricopeptide (TPR) repeat protein